MKFKLSEEVKKISNVALKDLDRTLWELPEYYLSVKLAESAKKQGYSFELEMSTKEIEEELSIALRESTRHGRIDLVIRTSQQKNLSHLIEIKRRLGLHKTTKDVLRLAEFCSASTKKSAKKAFLVVVTRASTKTIEKREGELQDKLDLHFKNRKQAAVIKVKEIISIAEYKNCDKTDWKDEHVVIMQITAKS